jgi:hypothetical protein
MRVGTFVGMRVSYHHTVHVMHMSKHCNAYLVRYEQRQ